VLGAAETLDEPITASPYFDVLERAASAAGSPCGDECKHPRCFRHGAEADQSGGVRNNSDSSVADLHRRDRAPVWRWPRRFISRASYRRRETVAVGRSTASNSRRPGSH
jgi:hypothetical protein